MSTWQRGMPGWSLAPIDPAVALLTERIERQVQEIGRLEKLVASYKDLFNGYQYNAHARGISPAELEMPLPLIDRRRSNGQYWRQSKPFE